ncbi:MAG: formate/nitrite transporter family protein [Lachnospiraceae bacterium]|nr:formate/nitrite transporter family protein [Lachnospiraceae bacterium]
MYIPSHIAKTYSEAGAAKTKFSAMKTFVLAVFAGMFIAIGAFGSQVALVDAGGESFSRFISAFVFPIGLFLVVMTGAELFTGNNLMVISVLDKKITVKAMLKNWVIAYLGNFVGSIFVAVLVTYGHAYSLFGGKLAQTAVTVAQNKVSLSFSDALFKGILCNMLVCIAVLVSLSAEEVAGKILGLYLPILMFVLSGFEHSVANMFFIPAGFFVSGEYNIGADSLTWSGFLLHNLIPVTIGNMIGGACIVGLGYGFLYLNHGKEKQ